MIMVRLLLGYIVGINYNNDCRCILCDSLTEKDSIFHFISEYCHNSIKVNRQELCNLIKYDLRLDWLSNIALADVFLLANVLELQTVIAILKIACEMDDLKISFLCEKG